MCMLRTNRTIYREREWEREWRHTEAEKKEKKNGQSLTNSLLYTVCVCRVHRIAYHISFYAWSTKVRDKIDRVPCIMFILYTNKFSFGWTEWEGSTCPSFQSVSLLEMVPPQTVSTVPMHLHTTRGEQDMEWASAPAWGKRLTDSHEHIRATSHPHINLLSLVLSRDMVLWCCYTELPISDASLIASI